MADEQVNDGVEVPQTDSTTPEPAESKVLPQEFQDHMIPIETSSGISYMKASEVGKHIRGLRQSSHQMKEQLRALQTAPQQPTVTQPSPAAPDYQQVQQPPQADFYGAGGDEYGAPPELLAKTVLELSEGQKKIWDFLNTARQQSERARQEATTQRAAEAVTSALSQTLQSYRDVADLPGFKNVVFERAAIIMSDPSIDESEKRSYMASPKALIEKATAVVANQYRTYLASRDRGLLTDTQKALDMNKGAGLTGPGGLSPTPPPKTIETDPQKRYNQLQQNIEKVLAAEALSRGR